MIIDVVVAQCYNSEHTKELSLVLHFWLQAIYTAALFGASGGTQNIWLLSGAISTIVILSRSIIIYKFSFG